MQRIKIKYSDSEKYLLNMVAINCLCEHMALKLQSEDTKGPALWQLLQNHSRQRSSKGGNGNRTGKSQKQKEIWCKWNNTNWERVTSSKVWGGEGGQISRELYGR